MTKSKAAIIIGNIPIVPDECYTVAEYQEAKTVAINALEYQAAAEKLWEIIEQAGYEGKEVEIRRNGKLFKIREVAQ